MNTDGPKMPPAVFVPMARAVAAIFARTRRPKRRVQKARGLPERTEAPWTALRRNS
jgi:hypothetical protein